MYKSNLTLLYSTCDKNEFLWEGFFLLLDKYWKKFDGDIIFNSESKTYTNSKYNLKYSLNQYGANWSRRFYKSLKLVKTKYVLVILDDFYIDDYVADDIINECIQKMNQNKNIKGFLFSQLTNNKKTDWKGFEKIKHFKNYRINLKIGLWDKEYLMNLCRDNETPWEYEVLMSLRSFFKPGDIYAVTLDYKIKYFPTSEGYLLQRGYLDMDLKNLYKKNTEFYLMDM